MARNTRKNSNVNKYWENETPIITTTETAEVRYFKEAGKVQLYSFYENKDGEKCYTKACVWNNEMDADDATRLAYAIMQGLLDSGVESEAFMEAYEILDGAVSEIGDSNEDADDEEEENEVLDEEFEDDVDPYEIISNLSREDAVKVAKLLKVKVLKKDDNEAIADKISEDHDDDEVVEALKELNLLTTSADDDEEDETEEAKGGYFDGKHFSWVDGELKVKAIKTAKGIKKYDVYVGWAEDALNWAGYIVELKDELKAMPTKSKAQKSKQNKRYEEIKSEIADWVSEWAIGSPNDDKVMEQVGEIAKQLLLGDLTSDEGCEKFFEVVDGMNQKLM